MTTHDPAHPRQLVDHVTAGPGGAMTDEVGVITGDLTLATRLRPDGLEALHHDLLERIRRGNAAQATP